MPVVKVGCHSKDKVYLDKERDKVYLVSIFIHFCSSPEDVRGVPPRLAQVDFVGAVVLV